MNKEAVIDIKVLESLNALSLFSTQDIIVSKISLGLSHDCYLVSISHARSLTNPLNAKHNTKITEAIEPGVVMRYFSKRLISNGNISSGDFVEAEAIGYASLINITPKISYLDNKWLIQPYVNGTNLDILDNTIENKISYVLPLLVKCHEITPVSIYDSLNNKIVDELSTNGEKSILPVLSENSLRELLVTEIKYFEGAIKDELDCRSKREHTTIITQKLVKEISQWLDLHEKMKIDQDKSLVLCHGDANFSNVLIAETGNYLVDFECASWSEREYDLAMLIAINELPLALLSSITTEYKRLSGVEICDAKVRCFLPYCLALNALWFMKRAIEIPIYSRVLEKAQSQIELLKCANNPNNVTG